MPVYSDADPFLRISNAGDVIIYHDEDSVVRSVKNIISTISGERVRNTIGTRIVRLLFQTVNDDVARQLQNEIVDTVSKFEPRVDIRSCNVSADYDGNSYSVQLIFNVQQIRGSQTLTTRLRSLG